MEFKFSDGFKHRLQKEKEPVDPNYVIILFESFVNDPKNYLWTSFGAKVYFWKIPAEIWYAANKTECLLMIKHNLEECGLTEREDTKMYCIQPKEFMFGDGDKCCSYDNPKCDTVILCIN